jgi:uncharacterized protein YaaQ
MRILRVTNTTLILGIRVTQLDTIYLILPEKEKIKEEIG